MRHAPFLAAGLLAGVLATSGRAQQNVGDDAPDVAFDSTFNLNIPGAKSLKALRGAAVLVEYWATW